MSPGALKNLHRLLSPRIRHQDPQSAFLAELIALILSLSVLVAVASGVYSHFRYLDVVDRASLARIFVDVHSFSPTNAERLAYLIPLLLSPATLYLSFVISHELVRGLKSQRRQWVFLLASIMACILLLSLAYLTYRSEKHFTSEKFRFSLQKIILTMLVISVIFLGTRIARPANARWVRVVFFLFDIAALYAVYKISAMNVFAYNSTPDPIIGRSFAGYFESVADVYSGKALLPNIVNRYGLYPRYGQYSFFLEPIFRLTGLSVLKFTIVMAVLSAASYVFLYLFLRKAVKNRLVSFGGFVMVVLFNVIVRVMRNRDPYLQYFPHRLFFPLLFLLVAAYYFEKPSKKFKLLIFLLCSAAILWNTETGLIVFVSWVLCLAYSNLLLIKDTAHATRDVIWDVLTGVSVLVASTLMLSAYVLARYGSVLDFRKLALYPSYFVYGWIQTPIPTTGFHPWMLLILVYVIGLLKAAKTLYLREKRPDARLVFMLSVFGAGLFTYYLGHSHDEVLLCVCYPALIILLLFFDNLASNLYNQKVSIHRSGYAVFLLFLMILVYSNVVFWTNMGFIDKRIETFQYAHPPSKSTLMDRKMNFIREHTAKGEKILIVSYLSSVYYTETGTVSPLNTPGFYELYLQDDLKTILLFLRGNDPSSRKVIVHLGEKGRSETPHIVVAEVLKNYKETARNSDNTIVLYEKTPDSPAFLPGKVDASPFLDIK